jgi:hypothetical protein
MTQKRYPFCLGFSTTGKSIIKVMTNQDTELVKELDHRLQQRALQNKNGTYRSEIKMEGLNIPMRAPVRIQQPTMQRAQHYTGDA